MKFIKSISSAVAAALLIAALPVQAGSISRGGSSFSKPSAPARSFGFSRPAPKPTYTPPPVQRQPTYRTNPNVPPPAPQVYQAPVSVSQGPSLGGTAVAAGAGALGGVLLGHALTGSHGGGGTTVINNGAPVAGVGGAAAATGGAIPVDPVAAAGVPQGVAYGAYEQPRSAAGWVWSAFWLIVSLACLAGLIYGLYRLILAGLAYRKAEKDEALNYVDEDNLPFDPALKFIRIQDAFAKRDESVIHDQVIGSLAWQFIREMPEEAQEKSTLTAISWTVSAAYRKMISIRFKAHDTQDGTDLDEVWHFELIGPGYKLAGIEQN